MTEQHEQYKPNVPGQKDVSKDYHKLGNLDKAGKLLEGIDALVSNKKLAENYTQQGGQ